MITTYRLTPIALSYRERDLKYYQNLTRIFLVLEPVTMGYFHSDGIRLLFQEPLNGQLCHLD